MNNKQLIILSIVAAITASWAVIQSNLVHSRAKSPARTSFEESYLIQGLNLSTITSIQVGTGDEPATLVRQDKQFVVQNNDEYPADTAKVNTLLADVMDIRGAEFVTNNPDNHESLGVTEENAQNIIKFFGQNEELLTGVIIGTGSSEENEPGNSRQYVRLISSDDVYQVDHVPNISGTAVDYTNTELLKIDLKDIERVEIRSENMPYTIEADPGEGDTYRIKNLPAGRQLKQSEAKSLFSAFTNISFTNVKRDAGDDENLTSKATGVCYLKNQIAYTLEVLQSGETYYLKMSSEYLDTTPVVKEQRVESDEELKAKEEKLLARDNAEQFNQKHQGWLYEVYTWKGESLTKALDDMIEDIPAPEESAAPDTGESNTVEEN